MRYDILLNYFYLENVDFELLDLTNYLICLYSLVIILPIIKYF
jgi:hypothetical protein